MLYDYRGRKIEYAEAQAAPPVFEEVSSTAKEDFLRGFVGELRQVRDDILRGLPGAFLEGYRKLLADDQVHSTFQQRRRAVIAREWNVEAGGRGRADQMAADWLRETIEHVGWDRVVDRMLFGTFYGYAVAEMMYARDGARVMVDDIRVRDRSRFRFDRDFGLRLLTPQDQVDGEEMPPNKFWVFQTGADHDDDPYGLGLAHFLYWPVTFKRQGVKLWLGFLDAIMRGSPFGKFAPGTPPHEQVKLLQALQILREGGAIVVPEGMELSSLDVKRGSTPDNSVLYDKMNEAIAKVNLSQTMTTDAASTGLGSTQGDVQANVAEAVQKADADLIASSFSAGTPYLAGPLEWLTAWNFPEAERPIFSYVFEEPEDQNAASERDTKLFGMGYAPTPERVERVYGEGYEPRQGRSGRGSERGGVGERATNGEAPEFAEPEELANAHAEQLAPQADAGVARWVGQVRALLAESADLSEFSDRLIELYPELDAAQLADVMGDALTAAHLAGRSEVDDGN